MSKRHVIARWRVCAAAGLLVVALCAGGLALQPAGDEPRAPVATGPAGTRSTAVEGESTGAPGGPVPDPPDTAGDVVAIDVDGDAGLGTAASTTYVYTPPGYDPASSTRYPVVYLFHGTPGASADWFYEAALATRLDGLIGAGDIPPVIAVSPEISTPDVPDTRCMDSTTGGPRIDTYLTKSVIPWVDETYSTYADADHRVLMGFSMGAFCATNLMFQHQDVFSAAAAMADYGEPGPDAAPLLADDDEYSRQSPAAYLADPDFAVREGLRFYLTVGARSPDTDVEDTPLLADLASQRGVEVVYEPDDAADHDWDMVSSHVDRALEVLLTGR